MNFPQPGGFPPPPGFPAPQAPTGPAPQPMPQAPAGFPPPAGFQPQPLQLQQPSAPQQFPPQPPAPVGFPAPQQQFQPQAPQPQFQPQAPQQAPAPMMAPVSQAFQQYQQAISRGATTNVLAQYLQAPPRQAVNRARIDDGDHVVIVTNIEVRDSQSGGSRFVLISYKVFDSTQGRCIGQEYGWPIKWEKPYQQQELADFYKAIFGLEQAAAAAQQGLGPEQLAQQMVQGVQAAVQRQKPIYVYVRAKRSQKKLREGHPYDEVFPNHYWQFASGEPFDLPSIGLRSGRGG